METSEQMHNQRMKAFVNRGDISARPVNLDNASSSPKDGPDATAPAYESDTSPPKHEDIDFGDVGVGSDRSVNRQGSLTTVGSGRSDNAASVAAHSENGSQQSAGGRSNRSLFSFLSRLGPRPSNDHRPTSLRESDLAAEDSRPSSQSSSGSANAPSSPSQTKSEEGSVRTDSNGFVDIEGQQEQPQTQDETTAQHEAELARRAGWSVQRKFFRRWSPALGVFAVITTILLLVFSKSKAMTRASFMGGIMVLDLSVVSWMIADAASKVEVLIAANLVVVVGIFMTSHIDAFFGYT